VKEEEEEECEDVERVILFEDVSPYLFTIQTPAHRYRLVVNFIGLLKQLLGGVGHPGKLCPYLLCASYCS